MTSIVAPAAFYSRISSSSWTKQWMRAEGKFKKKKKGGGGEAFVLTDCKLSVVNPELDLI